VNAFFAIDVQIAEHCVLISRLEVTQRWSEPLGLDHKGLKI
jgi:hypothetical protein